MKQIKLNQLVAKTDKTSKTYWTSLNVLKFTIMRKYFILILISLSFVSCEKFLDEREITESIDDADVFGSYYNMRRYLDDGYTKLYNTDATEMFSRGKNHTHLSQFADESSTNIDRIPEFKAGNWTEYFQQSFNILGDGRGEVEFFAPYILGWQGIRIANRTIMEINSPSDITAEQQDQILGQAYFIRAMCYFQILKRWGGMPYFTEPLNQNDYLGFERLSYQETATNIVEDAELAFQYLPLEWDSDNIGRPVKSAALALKSRVLLYAASKTNNTENDLSRWQAAAEASDELIKFLENEDPYHQLVDASDAINVNVDSINDTDYTEPEPESLSNYRHIFLYETRTPETMFSVYRENVRVTGGGSWKRYTLNLTYYVGKAHLHAITFTTGLTPNQNFVDLFETKNGLAPEDDPDFNPQNPYIKRDPRFYNAVIYNGVNWPVGTDDYFLELYNVGEDGSPGEDRELQSNAPYPHTGYMTRKWWVKGGTTTVSDGGPRYAPIIVPYFRAAEAYLNYAESAFEASGRSNINAKYSGDGAEAAYTALDAINKVRNRVGMPNLHESYQNTADFMDRIRNERAIEFAFEGGHRWFDILRWHMLDEVERVYGIYLEWNDDTEQYPTNYKFEKYELETHQKTFTERNYRYPIDPREVNQYPEFLQNPEW